MASPTAPETRLAKLKDGRTHLAYKPEHAVDLDTGAIVAAEIHLAHQGDTTTLPATLKAAQANLAAVDAAPTPEDPAALVADKGYHSRDRLKELEGGAWKSRIAEKKQSGVARWHGDDDARRAVYNNRARLRSGGPRRCSSAGPSCASAASRWGSTVAGCGYADAKRYLVHVAGYNLGRLMRLLVGAGTPRELVARAAAHLLMLTTASGAALIVLTVMTETEAAMLVVSLEPEPHS